MQPGSLVRCRHGRPPAFPHMDLGIVTEMTHEGRGALVAFVGGYPQPWTVAQLEEVENPAGVLPLLMLDPGGFYSHRAYWQYLGGINR